MFVQSAEGYAQVHVAVLPQHLGSGEIGNLYHKLVKICMLAWLARYKVEVLEPAHVPWT